MAADDIVAYKSVHGQYGRVVSGLLDGSSTHLRGEPIIISAGLVKEGANDPDFTSEDGGAQGLAVVGAQEIADATGDGTITNSANEPCQYALFEPGTEYYTRNMYDGGSGTTFAVGNIGDEANLEIVSTVWGIDVDPARFNFVITGLLDDNGRDAIRQGTTVTGTTFRLITK